MACEPQKSRRSFKEVVATAKKWPVLPPNDAWLQAEQRRRQNQDMDAKRIREQTAEFNKWWDEHNNTQISQPLLLTATSSDDQKQQRTEAERQAQEFWDNNRPEGESRSSPAPEWVVKSFQCGAQQQYTDLADDSMTCSD
jgi:hypothetical protein